MRDCVDIADENTCKHFSARIFDWKKYYYTKFNLNANVNSSFLTEYKFPRKEIKQRVYQERVGYTSKRCRLTILSKPGVLKRSIARALRVDPENTSSFFQEIKNNRLPTVTRTTALY